MYFRATLITLFIAGLASASSAHAGRAEAHTGTTDRAAMLKDPRVQGGLDYLRIEKNVPVYDKRVMDGLVMMRKGKAPSTIKTKTGKTVTVDMMKRDAESAVKGINRREAMKGMKTFTRHNTQRKE